MITELTPGVLITALALHVPLDPVAPDRVVSGHPFEGSIPLDERHGREFGVWEITPGVSTATEDEEIFIVLSGRATIAFEHVPWASGPTPPIELAPGSVVRLTEGMRTVWTVHETLRKIYFV